VIDVKWSIEDDVATEDPNKCNDKNENLVGEKDSGYRGC
jgi:hypothetical protein